MAFFVQSEKAEKIMKIENEHLKNMLQQRSTVTIFVLPTLQENP
jgi:hypothetical protein